MSAVRLVVTGVGGRMGSTLVRLAREQKDLQVVAGTERPGSPLAGADVGVATGGAPLGVNVVPALETALGQGAQVVIDFTGPEATMEHARLCAAAGVPLVVGSTGFGAVQRAELQALAKRVALVVAPNMSVGVNVVIGMARQLARSLGDGYDIEVVETHHRKKKDAPSGTALRLAEEIAEALGRGPEDLRRVRDGQVGERPATEIGVQSLRGGDVVGDHTVYFLGDGERVELTHRATSRDQFAAGALRAARWVQGKSPGLYDMNDVLGLPRR